MQPLVEPRIHGDGTAEALWAVAPELAHLPDRQIEELVPPDSRAVFVAPHPDDEVLATGGLIHMLQQRHRDILVIAVTEGEGSHESIAPAQLAQRRAVERTTALGRLGVTDSQVWSMHLPDGNVGGEITYLTRRLEELLRVSDVVFHPWERDGHPDHEATGLATKEAACFVGAVGYAVPIWAWHWCQPGDGELPFKRACKVRLPEATLAAKRAAIAAFSSQLEDQPSRGPILTPQTITHFTRKFEVVLS